MTLPTYLLRRLGLVLLTPKDPVLFSERNGYRRALFRSKSGYRLVRARK